MIAALFASFGNRSRGTQLVVTQRNSVTLTPKVTLGRDSVVQRAFALGDFTRVPACDACDVCLPDGGVSRVKVGMLAEVFTHPIGSKLALRRRRQAPAEVVPWQRVRMEENCLAAFGA